MRKLSTHVLDTALGRPAAGVKIELRQWQDDAKSWQLIKTDSTNADGRTTEPLLTNEHLSAGRYQLSFQVGDYFRAAGVPDAGEFLDVVPVEFHVNATDSYHVPLLVSPWSYSTYRGS